MRAAAPRVIIERMNQRRRETHSGRTHRDAILAYIADFRAERGYSPSIREIGDAMWISSTSVVAHHVRLLVSDGRLSRVPGVARSYVPCES